jgi:dUTP pyrophosphatase
MYNVSVNGLTQLPILKFKKTSKNAITPTKGSKLAAGYDLYSAMDCNVLAKSKALVAIDIQVMIIIR